jgi:two-component system chemotaxis response regulator CheB
MYDKGALTIAQDRETSVVYGMPQEAIKRGGAREVLPITAIGKYIAGLRVKGK